MRWLSDWWFRLRAVARSRAMERELDEELSFHLEMEARKLMGQGLDPNQAAREARRRFDGVAQEQEAARDSWGIGLVRDFIADLRQSLRQFRRRPAFSFLGVLTLALGLGVTVALSSVVRAILVRPLPVANESDLRMLWGDYDWRGVEFDFLKERTRAFVAGLAAFSTDGTTLRTEQGSAVLLTGVVSAELFGVLGTPAARGRTFAVGEDRPGAEPVAVLSWGVWQQELGGDSGIIGRRIILDGAPVTVIGVMPRGFFFPSPDVQIWRPLPLDPASGQYHGNGWLMLLGRIKPGTTPAQVDQDVVAMAKLLGERFSYPAAWDKTKDPHATPLREYLVGDVKPALLLLLGAGVLLLLMACANVAALVLARTTDRTHEMALRAALGAGQGRLARQIITEAVTFSVVAGGVGLIVASASFRLLVASLPLRNGMAAAVSLDWTAFGVALGLSLAVGLLVAAAPVRDLLSGRLQGLGSERGVRGLARGTGRVHSALVSGEAAVAVLLVVGALLLIRSVERLLAIDLGFEPRGVVAVDVIANGSDIAGPDRSRLYRELVERAGRIPGVTGAAIIARLPLRDGGWQGTVNIVGRPELEGAAAPNALWRPVSTDFFRTMGIDIVKGRGFESTDRPETSRVGVVSEAFAARAWPGEDPVGRLVRTGISGDTLPITVVGVAEEAKMSSIAGANPFVLYAASQQQQSPGDGQVLLVRSGSSPGATVAAVRALVSEIEPRAAIARVTTMSQVVATTLAEPLQLRFFLTLFAGVALLLGIIGVYSVVSYSVSRRQTEFGVRLALGAAPGQVLRQVVSHGVAPVAAGTVVGLVSAVALARGAAGFLYGVSPADPLSMGLAALALLGAGVAAAAIPAFRASRVSPVESLRAE